MVQNIVQYGNGHDGATSRSLIDLGDAADDVRLYETREERRWQLSGCVRDERTTTKTKTDRNERNARGAEAMAAVSATATRTRSAGGRSFARWLILGFSFRLRRRRRGEIDERGRTIGSREGEERRWNECDGIIVDERRDRGEGKGAIETRRARLDDDDMTTDFTRFRFSLCVAQYHQYQVVGRHVPTEANPEPEVFRMKLWALDAVKARSKFWYVDSPR